MVEITFSGLGTLRDTISTTRNTKAVYERLAAAAVAAGNAFPVQNLDSTLSGLGLTTIKSGKKLNVEKLGDKKRLVVFVHGLGGNTTFYTQLID